MRFSVTRSSSPLSQDREFLTIETLDDLMRFIRESGGRVIVCTDPTIDMAAVADIEIYDQHRE
jgi:hypothetical protein